ncbi:MAG: hypothetical protein AMXMBFR34_07830 [Myxococcaceae bacterium]
MLLLVVVLSAVSAVAEARLLPEEALLADVARVDGQLLELSRSSGGTGAIGLGVASLLVGMASAAVGIVLFNGGEWHLFVPLVVLVPALATLLGTTLIIGGAVASGPGEDEVRALQEERGALLARRAALVRARAASVDLPDACTEVAAEPATTGGAATTPSAAPARGHLRGPLKPASAN